MLAHVARIVTLRNQKSRSSGDLLAYVHSRCGTKRTMAYAALACRCRTPSTRMLDQPFGPVRPPRSLMRLRPRQPVIRIVGQDIRKIRAGMMPPPTAPRPAAARLDALAEFLETSLDRAAAAKPRPGRTVMHRLNRTEYGNAIRDLLALDIDAAALLPPDDESSGFDNIADVLTLSPSLMERYLSAAWNISRTAEVISTPRSNLYKKIEHHKISREKDA